MNRQTDPPTVVMPVLELVNVSKSYGNRVLFQNVCLSIHAGEFIALKGESGSGKSSLLNIIAGLDSPSSGESRFLGRTLLGKNQHEAIGKAQVEKLAAWRAQHLGFVFQAFHLLSHLTLAQNVAVPLLLLHQPMKQALAMAAEALAGVGLAHRANDHPNRLSGGEQQRVALARAVVHSPRLLLADEPTGNLDEANAVQALTLLKQSAQQRGCAVLMVTHSDAAACIAQRQYYLKNQTLT